MSLTGPWTTPSFASQRNRDRCESLTSDVLAIRVGFLTRRPTLSHVAGMVRAELLTVDRYETGKQAALTRAPSDTVAPDIIVRERRRASRLPSGASRP